MNINFKGKEAISDTFPQLCVSRINGDIILFESDDCGMILRSTDKYRAGTYSCSFLGKSSAKNCKPFNGIVELSMDTIKVNVKRLSIFQRIGQMFSGEKIE